MTIRENLGLLVVGILGCTFVLQRCNKPTVTKGPAQITYSDGGSLIQIQHRDPKTGKVTEEKIFEPDPKSTVITTDAKGNVTVKVRQFGVGFDPGIGIGLSNRARVMLDARIAFYKRFGLNTGLGFNLDKNDYTKGHMLDIVDPYLAGSYVPFTTFPNTSLVTGYGFGSKHVVLLLRVRF